MSGTSAYSEALSSSGRSSSGMSGISETSKKSKRQGGGKKTQKLRKKRQVKEGSPYEEAYLIDSLKEEVKITQADKDEVKDIMKALLYFGLIQESTGKFLSLLEW